MSQMTLNSYLSKICNAWEDYDGKNLANLLSFEDSHITSPKLQIQEPESAVERMLEQPLDEVVAAHIRACWAWANSEFSEAFKCQEIVVSSFARLLSASKDDNWLLPVMQVVCLDLRNFAHKADIQLSKSAKHTPGQMLEKASEGIMACFRVCAADARATEETSKKWGMLNLVNQLFKIYFKVNKLHLTKPLIRAIESSALKDRYAKSQLVTYRYYVGRKYMFDYNFQEAEEYLRYAFEHCEARRKRNKRLILMYLVPVKMLLGQMPLLSLLEKYDLLQFKGIMESVKEGNLHQLNQELEKHEKTFIRWGIFLILEKLKIITYRNLFKKVALLMKTFQIPIEAFTVALKFTGEEDVDNDETACILANLIYEQKVKGYISHQHQKLVISKQSAFPALSTTA
eukprot:TRINITY_DN5185_c0_g1_i5.p1 TRINITY_DN5185_c0_g1~~TRINITY_DN5185_c0_g1_i5.p1  ORF type:complete len:409 (-),score=81.85 TRINITY_DN5185_c0_g1_i5:484-1683(-)